MSEADLADVEAVVRTIATVAVDNEKYFGDLDAVVGDGDFGYSMARGFELVLQGWDGFDRTDIGTFLKKVAVVITSRIGGTSGPIWGTAFLRAGAAAGAATGCRPTRSWRCCAPRSTGSRRAASRTWATRRCSTPWCPRWTPIEAAVLERGRPRPGAAGGSVRPHASGPRPPARCIAKRGRAAYTGERSIGTLDAGAVAVAVMFEALADQWAKRSARNCDQRRHCREEVRQ